MTFLAPDTRIRADGRERTRRVGWGPMRIDEAIQDPDVVTQQNRTASTVSIDLNVAIDVRDELAAEIADVFGRRESRTHAVAYVRALCSGLERKNGWRIAEASGDDRPDGKQRLLYRHVWDESVVRDRVRAYAVRHLGAADAGLIFDESGQEKTGRHTAGVGRQYTGTAGKITNAIVAVYTSYASRRGHCLIDADLYVQEAWFADPDRLTQAGFDPDHTFRTKPEIALEQARRILAAGIPIGWIAADEVYGRSAVFRQLFEDHSIAYVVAVGVDFQITTGLGTFRADEVFKKIKRSTRKAWIRRDCGQGTKGPRVYDWAMIATPTMRCSSAGRSPNPTTWPTSTPSSPPGSRSPYPDWSRSPDTGGWWKKISNNQRGKAVWTKVRSAATGPGDGTPSWPSQPTPSTP